MENGTNKKIPRLTLWLVWGALIQAVIIYFVILKLQVIDGPAEASPSDLNLKKTLLIVGIAGLVVAFIIRFTVTANKPAFAFPTYIVSLALTEVSAIFGLVLGFMGIPISELYPFFGMSLLGLLGQPPTVIPK